MANLDLQQLPGTPNVQVPTAGQMPQQPMVPQQFPVGNPLLEAAQKLGGFLRGDQNGAPNYPDVSGNPLTNAANLAQLRYLSPEERIKVMTGLAGIMSGHPVWSAALNGAMANSPADALAMLGGPGPKPTEIGSPDLFNRIQARNTLYHSTNLDAGQSILEEGSIIPKRYTDKFLNWGKDTKPDISGQRAGFTGPRTSLSRAQRVGDPISFEIDPAYVKNPKPVEALNMKARMGGFEFETGTQAPIPAEGIKNVLINTDRVNQMYGNQAPARIAQIKTLAAQRGIPVIEGTENELLSRRPLGMQGPMRPIQSQPLPDWYNRLAGSPTSTLKRPDSF